MANETKVPLEGTKAPGFFDKWGSLDQWLDFIWWAIWWAADVVYNAWDKIISWDFNFDVSKPVDNVYDEYNKNPFAKESVFSKEEIELSKKWKDITWKEQIIWSAKWFWQADVKPGNIMGKDSLLGSWIQSKLKEWVSEDQFNKNLAKIWMGIDDKKKAIKDIEDTDPRFFAFRDFSNSTYSKYLQKKNITQIEDETDYTNFLTQELSALDPIAQAQIIEQQKWLSEVTAKIKEEVSLEESKKNDFINSSINEEEWKKWVDIYNEFNKTQSESLKWDKQVEYSQEIFKIATDEFEKDMAKSWAKLWNLWTDYFNIREKAISARATRIQYILSTLADESNPWNVWLAAEMKKMHNRWSEYEDEKIRRLWDEIVKPENKWKSLVELWEIAEKVTWSLVSDEDKKLMKKQKDIVTSRSLMVEWWEFWDRLKNYDPMLVLDWVSYLLDWFQNYLDQAFDYEQEVPYYIRQEWRAMKVANEWNLYKWWTILTHNPDALIGMSLPMKPIGVFTKNIDTIISQLSKVDKALKIPVKIWFDSWLLRVIPNTMKWMQKSLITGAVWDTIIDNQMQQAKTSANESFNYVTWLLFDPIPFALWESLWFAKKSKDSFNSITFDFLHWDESKAVDDWMSAYNKMNPDATIDKKQAKSALEWAVGIISNVYSPDKIKSIFNEKWGIYRFLADNVSQMNTHGIKNLVTWTGLNIKINDIVWIPEKEYKSFSSLLEINDEFVPTTEFQKLKAKVVWERIDAHIKQQEAFLNWWVYWDAWVSIQKAFLNTPDYIKLAESARRVITEIKTWYLWKKPFAELQNDLNELNGIFKEIKWKYATNLEETWITLFNSFDKDSAITIKLDNLNDLAWQLDWKDFTDLLVSQKIKINKDITLSDWKTLRAWELSLVDSEDWFLSKKVDEFVKSIEDDIVKFETEIVPGGWPGLRQTIRNLFNTSRIDAWFLDVFEWELLKENSKKTAIFFKEILKKYYWVENVWDNIPYYGDRLLSYDKVLDEAQSLWGNINLSHGAYLSTTSKKEWKFVSMFYVTLWKDVISWSEWRLSINDILQKDFKWNAWDLAIYMNSTAVILKKILKYWLDSRWVFDFQKWLTKVKTINSIGETALMFEKWKIMTKELNFIAKDLWISDKDAKEIVPFVQKMFEWANEKDAFIIRPMIYSLMEQYSMVKPHLIEIFKRKWSWIKFTEAFANILIQPKLYDDLIKNMPISTELEKTFKEHSQRAWDQFYNDLNIKIKNIDENINEIRQGRLKESSQYMRDAMDSQIKILELNRSSLVWIQAKQKEFKENIIKLSKNSVNSKYLETQANNYALTRLLGEETPRDIPMPEIQQQKYFETQDLLIQHYANNKLFIDQLMLDLRVSDSLEKLTNLKKKYDLLPNIDENLRKIINNILDVWFYKWDGIEFINVDLFDKMLKRLDGSYDYDFAMENNPLSRRLSSWMAWSDNDRDFDMERRIVEEFDWEYTKNKTSYELYATNTDFRNMIDGMYSEKSTEIDELTWLPIINKKDPDNARFESFIKKLFKDTEITGVKKWNIIDINKELIDDLLTDYRMLNRFKRIKNFSIRSNEKVVEFVEIEWSDPKFPQYDFVLKDWEYTENILQLENMKWKTEWKELTKERKDFLNKELSIMDEELTKTHKAEDVKDFREYRSKIIAELNSEPKDRLKIFRNFSLTWVQRMRVTVLKEWKKEIKTIKNILEAANTEKFLAKDASWKLNPKDAYISSGEMYNAFVDAVNFIERPGTWNLLRDNAMELRNMLWLEDWDVWVWNFGDKDSLYTTYKSWKDIYSTWISQSDRSKIELSLYKYEYAFSNGYINPTSDITTFDGWFKKVVEPLLAEWKFSSFDDYVKKIDPKLYGEDWNLSNPYILTNKQIRKREWFNMSTRNTFEDYVVDTATYVIEKKIEKVEAISEYFNGKKYILSIEQLDDVIAKNLDSKVTEVFSYLRKWYGTDFDIVQINNFINLLFNNDLQDWTSWISNALIKIRSEIVWWKKWLEVYSKLSEWFSWLASEEDEAVIMLRNQFKDHYYGGEKRFWAKTLFTGSKIEVDWKELHNAVVVGESSMKLEWGYTEFTKWDWAIAEEINWVETGRYYKNITINWEKYRSFWHVPKTDTSYFKNAESDSYKSIDKVTVSDSITARLDQEYADAIFEIQKSQIMEAFSETLWGLSQYKIAANSYSSVVDTIRLISSNIQLGNWSSPILSWKMKELISKLKQIISKPKDDWASLYIHEAALDIGLNEVLVSKESKLYKTVVKKMEDEIAKLDPKIEWNQAKIDQLQDDIKTWNLHTVAYRYPVPSKYNLGLYKIITIEGNEKYARYKTMWSDAVVAHPLSVYWKWEWDADGDGITFVPVRDWVGKILTNALLKNAPDADVVIPDKFMNDFIIAEQVDKALPKWWSEVDLLLDSRSDSVWAKQFVGIVSATNRTLWLLRQMVQWDFPEDQMIPYKKLIVDTEERAPTHVNFALLRDQIDPVKINNLDKKFEQVWASNIQKAVDGEKLEKDFYIRLLEAILKNPEDAAQVYYEFISPLSKMYGNSLPEPKKAYEIWQTKLKNVQTWWPSDQYIKFIYDAIWGRRKLNNFIINEMITIWNQEASIADFVFFMNKTKDLSFIIDTIVSPSKELKLIIDKFSKKTKTWKIPKQNGYIHVKDRKELSEFIENIKFPDTKEGNDLSDFLSRIKYYFDEKDIQKKQEIKWRILETLGKNVSDDARSIASLYALSLWEYDMFDYFSAKKKFEYLTMSDDKFMKRMNEEYWIKVPKRYIKDEELKSIIESRLSDLQIAVKEETNLDQVDFLEAKIAEANSEYKNLIENAKEAELVSDPIGENTFEIPDLEYIQVIENSFRQVDSSPSSINEIASEFTAFNETSKSLFKFTTQSMFGKYAPKLLAVYNDIASFMNKKDNLVFYASKEHIRQFGAHYFWYKKSIRNQLINAWVPERKADTLWLVIQHKLLENSNKQFNVLGDSVTQETLKTLFDEYWVAKLVDSPEFMKEINAYKKNTIEVVASKLNQIQEIHKYDIQAAYVWLKLKGPDFSIVTDFIEMTNADPQFVLKINWIKDREAFEQLIISNAEAMGIERPWNATLRTMWNVMYKDSNKIDAVLNLLQWVHYQMTYWTLSTLFTQNSLIAWLAQILPNYVELQSYINTNPKFISEWNYILKKYWFLESENVIRYSNRLGMKPGWFEEFVSRITRDLIEWSARKIDWTLSNTFNKKEWTFISREAAMKSWEIVDSAINNMLGFNDWPLEHLRKVVAVRTAMEKLWYKSIKDLDNFIEFGWKDAEMLFHSLSRMNFANSWGWVVSSSPFSKWTIFENSYEYLNTGFLPVDFFVQFGVKSLSYLMWWSFHKAATHLEKVWALWSAVRQLLVEKNYKLAWAHFWDFYTHAYMVTKQLALATGLYLKFQKYERDNDNRVTLEDFQKQFSNAIVAVMIPIGKHIEAYDVAWEFGDGSDQLWFTTNSIINNALRLFKQPQFFNTMYNHYQTEDALWRWDMLDSFQYAMETHYTGSIKYTAMKTMNDHFNTVAQKWNLWILWLWTWVTNEDELFKNVMWRRSFTSWKDRWFITTILSWFTWMFSWDPENINMWVMNDLAKELTENVISKWELSKLFTGWQIWTWEKDYNLATLVGSWKIISDSEKAAVSSLWQNIGYYDYAKVNAKWELELYNSKWDRVEVSREQLILEKQITKELADLNINIADVIAQKPDYIPAFVKTLEVLQLKTWVKTPLIISSLMNMEYFNAKKSLADKSWLLTGKVSEYGTKYKELSIDDDLKLQRDIMMKYQESFNLNNTLIWQVIEADIIKNNKDLFSRFSWAKNENFIKENIYDLAGTLRLARDAMYNNNTKVAALTTRYSLIFKWIKETETWVKVILQTLKDVEANPTMDAKTKLANQAAMLASLNKTQLNVLKDNKEFEKLTEASRKELTNWLYKVSSASIDFDDKSMMNLMNQSAGSKTATRWSGYVRTLPKPQSSSFGWARPNFSQQFSPIRDFLPGKEWYLSRDPNKFLSSQPSYIPKSVEWFNPMNSRMVQEYLKIMINGLFYGYESKGTIRTGSTDKKFDKAQNTSIKIAKPKKAKGTKEFKKFKVAPKVSMWMRPDLPLANYWD